MIRETIAADLLALLAPLLASFLVVLTSLLAVETLPLAPSVLGILGSLRPEASRGFVGGETTAGFPLPLRAAAG